MHQKRKCVICKKNIPWERQIRGRHIITCSTKCSHKNMQKSKKKYLKKNYKKIKKANKVYYDSEQGKSTREVYYKKNEKRLKKISQKWRKENKNKIRENGRMRSKALCELRRRHKKEFNKIMKKLKNVE